VGIDSGTFRVTLDEELFFDTLLVDFARESRGGMAEIEVIGKAAPGQTVVRGDTNCDSDLNITDAIILLNSLFRGTGPVCCDVAADTSGDGRLSLADLLVILGWLYRGERLPAAASNGCAVVSGGSLGCAQEMCEDG